MEGKVKQLTALQEAGERARAFEAFKKEYKAHFPVPSPAKQDLFQDNPWVVEKLTTWIGYVPILLFVIAVASIVISSDKTMRAMHDSVAFDGFLYGAWSFLVTICAAVMLEGGLVVAEFARVRDQLSKGLRRRVLNLRDLRRAINVRLGNAEPLNYHEMPDSTLSFYGRFMFVLVLLANTYGVIYAYTNGFTQPLKINTPESGIEFTLFFVVGLGGALSLRLIGSQIAHMSYELYEQKRVDTQSVLNEQWREQLEAQWREVAEEMIADALHKKWVRVNGSEAAEQSPYLLAAGPDGELDLYPFESLSSQSLMPVSTPSSNGQNGRV